MKRNLTVGWFEATEEMRDNLLDVMDSGILSYGKYSREFEALFAQLHECEYATLVNSGTSALLIALQALKEVGGWKEGDEVIVPATTFVATSNVVLHLGLEPVFVDIAPDLNIDPGLIEQAITPRTRAIIPVHLCGKPANMPRIMEIARKHNLRVIEDSCEAMFVGIGGRSVGSWGDVGCFSTYVAHVITTGVGGVCTTNDRELAGRIRSLANHGLALEYLNPDANFQPRPMGNRRFLFDRIGHSFRSTEMEAAVGLPQLYEFQSVLRKRTRNAKQLAAGLKIINKWAGDPLYVFEPDPVGLGTHAWMIYPILLQKDHDKEPLMSWLNSQGVETRDLMPLLGQPADPYASLASDDFPMSRWVNESGFYVGCHQYLSSDDIQEIVYHISEYFSLERGK